MNLSHICYRINEFDPIIYLNDYETPSYIFKFSITAEILRMRK